jgi:Na+/H+ antiporter NhaD/arsenite permease-like protein
MLIVVMANIGGAMTPISDPTTYYQAKTVGLSFLEVVENSGVCVLILSVVSVAYISLVFRKSIAAVKVNPKDVAAYKPASALKNKKVLYIGTPLLFAAILLMVLKEYIGKLTGIHLDNASIAITGALLAIFIFKKDPQEIYHKIIDWEILFFFMGLFIVVGALEHNGVIAALAGVLITFAKATGIPLQFLITFGSGALSTFIDNVPYNIAMVGAIQAMGKAGVFIYPLWWGLNLGTSFGGAGSPIGAACNVVSFGMAEKEGIHTKFGKYLMYAFPLVLINALVTFVFFYVRYGFKP